MPSLYSMAIPPHIRGLKNLSAILTYVEEYATKNNIDPQKYLDGRLAPDMYQLPKQIYIATDLARGIAQRIAGVERLVIEDNQTTFGELRDRIAKTIEWLEAISPAAFEGKDDMEIVLNPQGPNGTKLEMEFNAVEYLTTHAGPQFWFHVTVAYSIFRHLGVDLGKRHFLNAAGEVKFRVLGPSESS